ncbi:MAG TPA: hypothetical protein VGG24_18140, partial [Paraburkholderia sp.]
MADHLLESDGALLPDGTDVSQYEKYESWSNRRWAWEFLRRSKEFREACHKYRKTPEEKRSRIGAKIAEKFHLMRFKDYTDSWSEKKDRLLFSRCLTWADIPEGTEERKINTSIRRGQILMRVDVHAMTSKREMEYVRDSIEELMERMMVEHAEETEDIPKLSRNREPGQLLLWLRMLDARLAGMADHEIYVMLENDIKKYSKTRKKIEDDPEGKIAERMRAADDMARTDYVALAF